MAKRRELLRVDKRALFQTIRAQYCSRCFGLFVLRFEELRGASPVECEACATFYVGMVVENGQTLTLEDSILETQPFKNFSEAKQRERERELQFMTGGLFLLCCYTSRSCAFKAICQHSAVVARLQHTWNQVETGDQCGKLQASAATAGRGHRGTPCATCTPAA